MSLGQPRMLYRIFGTTAGRIIVTALTTALFGAMVGWMAHVDTNLSSQNAQAAATTQHVSDISERENRIERQLDRIEDKVDQLVLNRKIVVDVTPPKGKR